MADIRIKDLATTASTTASDDFLAVDGTTNGTRKLSAATPSFATSVTVPGVAGPTSTDLTLTGGSTGASLVLGQGASAASSTITNTGTGSLSVVNGDYFNVLTLSRNSLATNTGTTMVFRSKDAGGTYVDVGAFFAAKSVATIGAVDSFLTWSTRRAGTLTDAMTLASTGNLLIGGTTDIPGSGGLKVFGTTAAGSTASGALQVAGGVGVAGAGYFGGALTVNGTGAIIKTTDTAAYLDGLRLQTGASSGSFYPGLSWHDTSLGRLANIYSFREGGSFATSMVFQTSIAGSATPTTALTINSAQAATFAGAVTTANKFAVSAYASNSFLTGNGSGFLDNYYNGGSGFDTLSLGVNYDRRNNAISSAIVATGDLRFEQGTGGQSNFVIALGGTNTVPTDRFTIASSGNATFSGAVSTTNSTASTGVGTGALQVAGGIYAGAASVFGGTVTVLGAAAITGNAATGKLLSVGNSGVLSSYWDGTNGRGIQIGAYSSFSESETSGASSFNSNAVLFDSANENSAGSYKRMDTGSASRIRNLFGTISLDTAVSSTPGSTITWVPQLTVNATTATFAGAVTVNAISGINALAAGTQLATFESSVNGAAVELITKGKNSSGTARQANIGINRFADDVLSFSNGTTESLRLHLTTQAATFSGAVAIGNTVNTVSPTSPNRTVTMVIGGVTYYLAAKTTND